MENIQDFWDRLRLLGQVWFLNNRNFDFNYIPEAWVGSSAATKHWSRLLKCENLSIKFPWSGSPFQCSFIQKAFPDALLCTSDSVYAVDNSGGSCLHGAYTVIKEMRINKEAANKNKLLH